MILDYLNLMINGQILSKVQDYVCIVGVQYVLRLVDLDDPADPIEPVSIIVRHHLILPAPLMHSLVDGVVHSNTIFPVKAHNQLV